MKAVESRQSWYIVGKGKCIFRASVAQSIEKAMLFSCTYSGDRLCRCEELNLGVSVARYADADSRQMELFSIFFQSRHLCYAGACSLLAQCVSNCTFITSLMKTKFDCNRFADAAKLSAIWLVWCVQFINTVPFPQCRSSLSLSPSSVQRPTHRKYSRAI